MNQLLVLDNVFSHLIIYYYTFYTGFSDFKNQWCLLLVTSVRIHRIQQTNNTEKSIQLCICKTTTGNTSAICEDNKYGFEFAWSAQHSQLNADNHGTLCVYL